jgi:3-hydroxybutyryl-CoA dehydrogenase
VKIGSTAVVGAGVMGSGIAQVLAVAGCEVRVFDLRAEAVAEALSAIDSGRFGLAGSVERGKLTGEEAAAARGRVSAAGSLAEACEGVDLALEAVSERLDLKLELFRELDEVAPPHAILASNTSGFPATALAAATRRPERVLVWHWASPPPVMKLAEIVVHERTSDETRDAVVELARRCGKNPNVVRDQPLTWGFVTNRIFLVALREAERLVAEGIATPEQVDGLLKDCFRWPAGPFELIGGAGSGWGEPGATIDLADATGEAARLAQQFIPFLARPR